MNRKYDHLTDAEFIEQMRRDIRHTNQFGIWSIVVVVIVAAVIYAVRY